MKPLYVFGRMVGRFAVFCTVRLHVLNVDGLRGERPQILAINHCSHYDPIFLSVLIREKIDWMSREEFFGNRFTAWFMNGLDCFPVDRFGNAVPGIREGLRRLLRGKSIGIFPEGEVMHGGSVLNGGSAKQGAFLLSRKTGVPVVPIVILGAEAFRKVGPWLPYRRGQLWIAVGDPIPPNSEISNNREGRRKMGEAWEESVRELANRLVDVYPETKNVWPE